ncbi:catechol 2,3-dioxygenase [Enhydrobacter aerosaccus]|uniref:Catechol 2,3-dioxygenase n=2 Tax=Enhydrobacter aerosaccus TaxID=225324 RepID=A0A1T4R8Q4_9HYPH|nr:catechol 2,3-dioxygenase [Enhydrobacter aerosaccus]
MSFAEPLHDIAHLGGIELFTPRFERSLWYFHDLLGMEVVHRNGSSAYLRGWGDHSVSTLKLTSADRPGVGCIAWRTVSPQALERRAEAITADGLAIGWTNGDFGRGRSFRFCDPDGHLMELYFEEQKYDPPARLRSALKNQPQKYTGRGVGVRRTDHLALLAADVGRNRRFAESTLGFQLREQVLFEQGKREIGSWMSPNAIHHQLAYVADVKGGHGRLHHISMWVDNREDVLRAADILVENAIFVEAGPSKHNNSQGFYLYSYEPGGNRVEIYSGSYLVLAPDWRPVTWNEEERGSGTYWGAPLPESFIQYATPDIEPPGRKSDSLDLPVFF